MKHFHRFNQLLCVAVCLVTAYLCWYWYAALLVTTRSEELRALKLCAAISPECHDVWMFPRYDAKVGSFVPVIAPLFTPAFYQRKDATAQITRIDQRVLQSYLTDAGGHWSLLRGLRLQAKVEASHG